MVFRGHIIQGLMCSLKGRLSPCAESRLLGEGGCKWGAAVPEPWQLRRCTEVGLRRSGRRAVVTAAAPLRVRFEGKLIWGLLTDCGVKGGSCVQPCTSVFGMLLPPWGAAGRLEVGRTGPREDLPVRRAVLLVAGERRVSCRTLLLGPFRVLTFRVEPLFLGQVQVCRGDLECPGAGLCVCSWSPRPLLGHSCDSASQLVLGPAGWLRRGASPSHRPSVLGQKEWLRNLLGLLLGWWFSLLRFINY